MLEHFLFSSRGKPGSGKSGPGLPGLARLNRTILFAGITLLTLALEASASYEEEMWKRVAEYSFNQARDSFAEEIAAGRGTRSINLGKAVALLNAQPKTQRNLFAAIDILEGLTHSNENDEVHIIANYLMARVYQWHLPQADPAAAERIYRTLIENRSEHFLSQQAIVKLAAMEIYRNKPDARPESRIAEAETFQAQLSDPVATRDYHLLLARAYLFFELSEERALEHLLRANATGKITETRADVLVSIGELAFELEDYGRADEAYAEFVETYPRDTRTPFIREKRNAIRLRTFDR